MKKEAPKISELLAQLEQLEAYFQKPDLDLDEALGKHKEAIELAKELHERLQAVEKSLQTIKIAELDTQAED